MNPTQPKNKGCHYPKKKDPFKSIEGAIAEQEDWVPAEAFKVAHDFRNKCGGGVN